MGRGRKKGGWEKEVEVVGDYGPKKPFWKEDHGNYWSLHYVYIATGT